MGRSVQILPHSSLPGQIKQLFSAVHPPQFGCLKFEASECLHFGHLGETEALSVGVLEEKSEFGVKTHLLIEKLATRKMGDLMVPQILLARCTRLGVYKNLGGVGADGGPWSWAIYGKVCQHWIFLEVDTSLLKRFWCSSSGCV